MRSCAAVAGLLCWETAAVPCPRLAAKCALCLPSQVPEAEARSYAAEAGLLFWEASAKADINVTSLFDEVADK